MKTTIRERRERQMVRKRFKEPLGKQNELGVRKNNTRNKQEKAAGKTT